MLEQSITEMEENREKETKIYSEQIDRLQSEVSIRDGKVENLVIELNTVSESCVEKQARIDECEIEIDMLKQMNADYEGMSESRVEQARLLSQQLENSKKEISAKITQILEHEETIHELNEEIKSLQTDKDFRINECSLLSQQLAGAEDRYQDSQSQIKGIEVSLEQSINSKDIKIRELQVELATANNKIEALDRMSIECEEDFKKRETLVERNAHLELKLCEREKEINQHEESMKNLSTAVTSMETKLVSLQIINDTLVIERDEFRHKYLNSKDEIKDNAKRMEIVYANKLKEETIERDTDIRLLKDAINNLQLKTQDKADVARTNSHEHVEVKTCEESKIDLVDEQIKTLVMTNTELYKEMKRKDTKLKVAQEVIAGLEKTLVVSALVDCSSLTSFLH